MTMFNADGTFDYNATISVPETEYVTLSPGSYYFTVDRVEYGTFQSNPQNQKKTIPDGCKTVELYMSVETPQGIAQVRDRFFLHQSVVWRIGAVHKCLGLMPEDEQNLMMNWDAMPGKVGVFKTKNVTGNTGTVFTNVDRYIYPSKVQTVMNYPPKGTPAPQQTNKYGGLL